LRIFLPTLIFEQPSFCSNLGWKWKVDMSLKTPNQNLKKKLSNALSNKSCAFRCSISRNCISLTGGGDTCWLSFPNWLGPISSWDQITLGTNMRLWPICTWDQGKASEQILLTESDRKFRASKFLLIGSDKIGYFW
jgi:hypothetical protein